MPVSTRVRDLEEMWDTLFNGGRWLRSPSSPGPYKKRKLANEATDADASMVVLRRSLLLTLPVELRIEILSYLMPLDILSLAHTNHAIRDYLLHPESKIIWARARSNLVKSEPNTAGWIDWVKDMHEARYVRYVWVKLCQMCGKDAPYLPGLPFLRIRLCAACTEQYCIDGTIAQCILPRKDLELLPCYRVPKSKNRRLYFRPAVLDLQKRLQELAGNETELAAFRTKKQDETNYASDHANDLEDWFDCDWNDYERYLVNSIKEKRLNEIRERFLELGFRSRDMDGPEFEQHQLIDTTEELTDSRWTIVRNHFTPLFSKRQAERLLQKNTNVVVHLIDQYYEGLSDEEQLTVPPLPDILSFPSIETLLSLGPIDRKTMTEEFNSNRHGFDLDVKRFQKKMRRDLRQVWDKYKHVLDDQDPDDPDWDSDVESVADDDSRRHDFLKVLDRATSVFRCRLFCKHVVHAHSPYHNCLRDEGWLFKFPPTAMEVTPWEVHLPKLVLNSDDQWIMESLVSTAGLPWDASLWELDDVGPRFRYWNEAFDEEGNFTGVQSAEAVDWQDAYLAKRKELDPLDDGLFGLDCNNWEPRVPSEQVDTPPDIDHDIFALD